MLATDALDWRLGSDGDLLLTENGFELVRGAEGVAQLCGVAAKLILGEWFLDQERGVDWFTMFQAKFSATDVQAALRAVWIKVPGVVEVVSVRATEDAATRGARVTGVVRTEFGDVEVNASVGGSP